MSLILTVMGSEIWFAGGRKPFETGDSVAITLPKEELKRRGIDPESLTEDDVTLDCTGERDEFRVDLSASSRSASD
jgi:hypothetical protein